jgi:hypothetical protein
MCVCMCISCDWSSSPMSCRSLVYVCLYACMYICMFALHELQSKHAYIHTYVLHTDTYTIEHSWLQNQSKKCMNKHRCIQIKHISKDRYTRVYKHMNTGDDLLESAVKYEIEVTSLYIHIYQFTVYTDTWIQETAYLVSAVESEIEVISSYIHIHWSTVYTNTWIWETVYLVSAVKSEIEVISFCKNK